MSKTTKFLRQMMGQNGGGWVPIKVNSLGQLEVVGSGVNPGATTIKIEDGATAGQFLAVDAAGRIGIVELALAIDGDKLRVEVTNQLDISTLAKTLDIEAVRNRLPAAFDTGALKVREQNPASIPDLTLTARMFAKQPQDGYSMWMDSVNANHTYLLEAPIASVASDVGFQGIRLPKPLAGKIEVNTGGTLTFDTRTTDGGWS